MLGLELAKFKNIDFFPPPLRAGELMELSSTGGSLCIATKSRALGDALVLTRLPSQIHARYPGIRITTYPRGFNPYVFKGNPDVRGVSYLPDRVYGDDANLGSGQLVTLKARFFGVEGVTGNGSALDEAPMLFLTQSEREWARSFSEEKRLPGNSQKPLLLLHPVGSTRDHVAPIERWDSLVFELSRNFRVWQLGTEGQAAVKGCEYYFLEKPRASGIRRLFALMSQAKAFVGVDSGPMHVARAFSIPSVVWVGHVDPHAVIAGRIRGAPYYNLTQRIGASLYSDSLCFSVNSEVVEKTVSALMPQI